MVPFRGKVHFKVYNPDKPDKYGVKSYQLCDSSNGFCCKFEIYSAVNTAPTSAKGKTYDLGTGLIQPYLNAGRCLYVDNSVLYLANFIHWFVSVEPWSLWNGPLQ